MCLIMNKFEHVWGRGRRPEEGPGQRGRGWAGGCPYAVGYKLNKFKHVKGSLYGKVQCIMGNGHMGIPPGNMQKTITSNGG